MAKSINTEERTHIYIYAKHVLSCSVGVRVRFYLFIFNERGTDCSLHKVLKCQEGRVWITQRPLFQEALVNVVRAREGALCRLLQLQMAKTASELSGL